MAGTGGVLGWTGKNVRAIAGRNEGGRPSLIHWHHAAQRETGQVRERAGWGGVIGSIGCAGLGRCVE